MTIRAKKKQEKMALKKAIEQEKKERKAREAAEKEKQRKEAFLAWQKEQEEARQKAIKEMADTAAVVATTPKIVDNPVDSMPKEDPKDYTIEEPTGIFGKVSKFTKEHSKGLKRTGAAVGAAVMLLAIIKFKGCSQDDTPNYSNVELPKPGIEQVIPPEVTKPNPTSPVTPDVSTIPEIVIPPEEPDYIDVTPGAGEEKEPATGDKTDKEEQGKGDLPVGEDSEKKPEAKPENQKENTDKPQEPVHTHEFTSFESKTYNYNNDNPHTHTISSIYECECGEKTTISEVEDCVYQIYNYDTRYEYLNCIKCGYAFVNDHEMDNGVVDSKTKDTTYSCIHDGCDYSYIKEHEDTNDNDDNRGHSDNTGGSHSGGSSSGNEPSGDDQKPDDQKPDDQKPDDQKPDDQKPDDQKPDDQKPDDQKPDDQKPDDQKPDDNKENDKTADSEVSQGDRDHETGGKDDHTDTGEYDDDDELNLGDQGNNTPVENEPAQSQEPSAPTVSEPPASVENAQNTSNDTPVSENTDRIDDDDLTGSLEQTWSDVLTESLAATEMVPNVTEQVTSPTLDSTPVIGASQEVEVTEAAEGMVSEGQRENEGEALDADALSMASIMYDYYTGVYGFDDNDLDEDYGRTLKL